MELSFNLCNAKCSAVLHTNVQDNKDIPIVYSILHYLGGFCSAVVMNICKVLLVIITQDAQVN